MLSLCLALTASGLTKAIAPVTEKYGVPMVEANGASRSLFTKGYKYLFAVLAPANLYLDVAIRTAVELNGKPVTGLHKHLNKMLFHKTLD